MTATYNGKIAAIHNIGQGKLVETEDGEFFLVDESDVEVLEWDGQTAHVPSLTIEQASIAGREVQLVTESWEYDVGGDVIDITFDEIPAIEDIAKITITADVTGTDDGRCDLTTPSLSAGDYLTQIRRDMSGAITQLTGQNEFRLFDIRDNGTTTGEWVITDVSNRRLAIFGNGAIGRSTSHSVLIGGGVSQHTSTPIDTISLSSDTPIRDGEGRIVISVDYWEGVER